MKTLALILILVAGLPDTILAFHDGTGIPHNADRICFTEEDAEKILRVVETSDVLIENLGMCEGVIVECENLVEVCNEQLEYRSVEVAEITEERDEGIRMLGEAQKAAKVAKKGSWWDRLKRDSSVLAIGAVIGGAAVLFFSNSN